jgi:hypothetical protein
MLGRAEGTAVGVRGTGEPGPASRCATARGDGPRRRTIVRPGGVAIWKLALALTGAAVTLVAAICWAGAASATPQATKAMRASPARAVALWHMNERDGGLMRDAMRNHDGHLRSVREGVPGLTGSAYRFNGRSSYVSAPSARDLNPNRRRIVLVMHLRTKGTPPRFHDWDLIRRGVFATQGGEYKMEYYGSGRASCGFNGSHDYAELVARPRLDDGHWHSIRCVKTQSRIKAIVDGRKFTRRVRIGKIANDASVVIGARPGSDWYRGALDQASIKIG